MYCHTAIFLPASNVMSLVVVLVLVLLARFLISIQCFRFTSPMPNTHTHSLCSAVNGVEDGFISEFCEAYTYLGYDGWLRPGFGFGFARIGGLGSLHCNVIAGLSCPLKR